MIHLLRNMRTWKRQVLGFGILAVALVIVAVTGWGGMAQLRRGQEDLNEEAWKVEKTHEFINAVSEVNLAVWQIISDKTPAGRSLCPVKWCKKAGVAGSVRLSKHC